MEINFGDFLNSLADEAESFGGFLANDLPNVSSAIPPLAVATALTTWLATPQAMKFIDKLDDSGIIDVINQKDR